MAEHSKTASHKNWLNIMSDLCREYRKLHPGVQENLGIVLGDPITGDRIALDFIVEASFKPGSRTVADIKYEWRLARLPYYVEWKLSKPNGELYGVVFQMVTFFLKNKWSLSRAAVEQHCNQRIHDAAEELENFVVKSRQQLQGTDLFDLSALRALGKQKQEKRKQSREDDYVPYLTMEGFSKHNIGAVDTIVSQVLAEAYNTGRTEWKCLALTWDEYENDDAKKKRKSGKKKKRRSKKNKKAVIKEQPHEIGSITDAEEDDDNLSQDQESEISLVDDFLDSQTDEAVGLKSTLMESDDISTSLAANQAAVSDSTIPVSSDIQSNVPSMEEAEAFILDTSYDDTASSIKKGKQKAKVQNFAGVYDSELDPLSEQIARGDWETVHPTMQQFSAAKTNTMKEDTKNVLDQAYLLEDHISKVSTGEFNSPLVSADTQDLQPHNINILPGTQQPDAFKFPSSIDLEAYTLDHVQIDPAIEMARHNKRRSRRGGQSGKHTSSQVDQTGQDNDDNQTKQETSSQNTSSIPTETPKSNARPTISSLSLLPGPLRDVIGKAATQDNIAANTRSKSSSSSLHGLVAIPDPKYLFKPKKSGNDGQQSEAIEKTIAVVSDTLSIAQSDRKKEVSVPTMDIEGQSSPKSIHHSSVLRAEAPEFVPISLVSSSAGSPELAPISSVPMSVSTSATSHASAGGGNHTLGGFARGIIAREGLDITFDLPGPPYTIKNAPMIYPSEKAIKELKSRSLDRQRSNSTSELPSITLSNFDEVEFAEQVVEEEQLIETWPEFKDGHLQVANPWRYANYDETPESIIMNHGHHDNNYRVSPYYTQIREIASRNNMLSMDVPGLLMKTRSGYSIATGQFDFENNVWRVFAPSVSPGADLRDLDDHPDYLEPAKLLEVQGLEMFLFNVHVAVRLIHTCQREACTNQLRDDHSGTVVCRGCGPLSPVRYCSLRCQFDDLPNHWEECGSSKFYPPVSLCVDPDISFPTSFKELFPLIKDISGFDSMERQRIHLASKCFDGEYGLFPEDNMKVIHIKMPSNNDNDELKRRVQRLINCALLDRRNKTLISYLYILIRDALCKQIKTCYGEYPVVLRFQFINEWKFDHKGPEGYDLLDTVEPCECMWVGTDNFSFCKGTCKAGQFIGEKFRETGLKSFVESLEKEHWILRAWYTRHPNVHDWRERVLGKGFHGIKPRKFKNVLPVLGVGFDGHISKDKVVGEWRPRLTLEAPPPPVRRVWGRWDQDPTSFIWKEPEA